VEFPEGQFPDPDGAPATDFVPFAFFFWVFLSLFFADLLFAFFRGYGTYLSRSAAVSPKAFLISSTEGWPPGMDRFSAWTTALKSSHSETIP
jgi:hypothetical protein